MVVITAINARMAGGRSLNPCPNGFSQYGKGSRVIVATTIRSTAGLVCCHNNTVLDFSTGIGTH